MNASQGRCYEELSEQFLNKVGWFSSNCGSGSQADFRKANIRKKERSQKPTKRTKDVLKYVITENRL